MLMFLAPLSTLALGPLTMLLWPFPMIPELWLLSLPVFVWLLPLLLPTLIFWVWLFPWWLWLVLCEPVLCAACPLLVVLYELLVDWFPDPKMVPFDPEKLALPPKETWLVSFCGTTTDSQQVWFYQENIIPWGSCVVLPSPVALWELVVDALFDPNILPVDSEKLASPANVMRLFDIILGQNVRRVSVKTMNKIRTSWLWRTRRCRWVEGENFSLKLGLKYLHDILGSLAFVGLKWSGNTSTRTGVSAVRQCAVPK